MGWTLHMIMCVLLCYPVSIRIYYQQGVIFLVYRWFTETQLSAVHLPLLPSGQHTCLGTQRTWVQTQVQADT